MYPNYYVGWTLEQGWCNYDLGSRAWRVIHSGEKHAVVGTRNSSVRLETITNTSYMPSRAGFSSEVPTPSTNRIFRCSIALQTFVVWSLQNKCCQISLVLTILTENTAHLCLYNPKFDILTSFPRNFSIFRMGSLDASSLLVHLDKPERFSNVLSNFLRFFLCVRIEQ